MADQDNLHSVEWLPERAYREEDQAKLWFHDSLHNNPPITPMGASVYHWPRGTQVAAEWISFPYSRGFDFVLYDGRIYPGVMPITDPEEIKAKEPVFGGKLKECLDNWPNFYAEGVREWTGDLSYLRGINKRSLPLDRLLGVLRDTIRISKRSWELHFIYMYPSIFAYMTFEAICKEYNIEEKEMRIFLQGFETKMFELDRAMWRLADLAQEMNLAEVFDRVDQITESNDAKTGTIKKMLNETELGKVWWDQFEHLLDQFGRRSTAAIFDPYYPTWNEDPYPVISTIKTYIQKGGFDFEEHTAKIIAERDRFIEETVARIPEGDKERFKGALLHAQYAYPFNEDHNYYVEQWTYSEVRYSILECGYRLQQFGMLEEEGDVFFLTISELEEVLDDIVVNQKIGLQSHGVRIPSLIKERKKAWNDLREVKAPPIIGTVPEGRVDDPVFIKIWGMTDEVIRGNAVTKDKVAGRFEGFPGAPGVVEGIARVIMGYEGFQEVQPDEILVAPFTTPAWTPLFSKIKGVVTDSGGMLAHAAICAREYNIPAVVGTITRGSRVTEHIKTGQRIRIDGTNGVAEVIG
ncbi:MAG: PEP-utilizing enzyme [Thermincola sp.]|jgi:pyruvate,water dikinase|nr:PEP-utilizing enzyme [Thermincola sp.]MDT3703328.1 PEP-utilizing enzyme [Thermincola sp.]